MRVKYIRWSTLQQTGARQLLDRENYDLVLQEQISGSIPFAARPEGRKLLDLVTTGKITSLYVEELTRLGRNAHDTINTLHACATHNVNVVVLNMSLHSIIDGKPNHIFTIVSYLLAALAEQEKEAIKERTEAGKVAARAKGVKFGRPEGKTETKREFLAKEDNKKIAAHLSKGINSVRQIAAITGTSKSTVMKVKEALT